MRSPSTYGALARGQRRRVSGYCACCVRHRRHSPTTRSSTRLARHRLIASRSIACSTGLPRRDWCIRIPMRAEFFAFQLLPPASTRRIFIFVARLAAVFFASTPRRRPHRFCRADSHSHESILTCADAAPTVAGRVSSAALDSLSCREIAQSTMMCYNRILSIRRK